jgi:adenosylcobinamide-phosphate synthase
MTLLSLLCVLILEQIRALPSAWTISAQHAYAAFLEQRFNGGEQRHGLIAWLVGVAVPTLLVLVLHLILASLHPLLAFGFDVLVLFLFLGFRQFSHRFTDIQLALRMGELEHARHLIAAWTGRDAQRLGSVDIARLAIEQGILSSHRHVFAPLFWFLALGPAGVILYRLGFVVAERWHHEGVPVSEAAQFGRFARQAYEVLDWLPARLTAASFAIVGNFEDAVYCWRTQASQWASSDRGASGILLASGAGAMGIRLGLPLPDAAGVEARPELGLGDDADVDHLQSTVGLIWRALVLCLLLLALLTVATWAAA